MKLSARPLCLILAFALILTLAPAPARAVEDAPDTAAIPFQINPLYRHLYTAEDFSLPDAQSAPEFPEFHSVTYLTVDEAAAEVRRYMKDRDTQFTVSFQTNISTYQTAAEQVLDAALAHTGAGDEGDYLLWQYGGWGAQMSRKKSDGMYLFTATYTVSYYTTAQQEAEVDTAIEELIDSLDIRDKSDYEKVCAVYDYLCDNVDYGGSYSDPALRHTAYAALIHKKSVCQGYALLFYRLMLDLGVDARLIPGVASTGEAHGWNIVELDGLYYNVDATWDANHSRYSYFLCNTKNFVKHYRYLDYETWEFHDSYPMAADNYDPDSVSQMDPVIYSGACGRKVTWTLNRDHSLSIGGSGATYDYTSETLPWLSWNYGIRTLVVEEGVNGIGDSCFAGMDTLTAAQLPEGLSTIGDQAFADCTGLREVRFLGDAPSFGDNTFENVTATLYYPGNNTTWSGIPEQDMGGHLSWIAYIPPCAQHSYSPVVTAPTCQTQGYTTFTCTVCDDSYISDYTGPVAHCYENNSCIWCGDMRCTVKWAAVNTSLTGSIDLNFYVVLSDNLANNDTFVRFTCNGETRDVPFAEAFSSVKDGVTRYRFSYKIYAKHMTDIVTAQVMAPEGPIGEAMSYSVAKYCYGMIDYSANAEMVDLCKAMLNYGAAAQKYFGYKLDDLANADLSESEQVVADFDPTPYAHSVAGSEEGINASGAKLLLEADVAIQVSFALTGDKAIDAYTVTIDGVTADYTEASGNKYYYELDGIAASRFNALHAFSVGGLTLNYSVLSYANQVYKSSTSPEARALVNAMYAYCMAAAAYVN